MAVSIGIRIKDLGWGFGRRVEDLGIQTAALHLQFCVAVIKSCGAANCDRVKPERRGGTDGTSPPGARLPTHSNSN